MQVYRGTVELLDYVFFATTERGKIYETGSFIHNYALAYALGLVRSETYTYAHLIQEPHYAEELTPLNDLLYLTPAAPLRVSHRLVQWNTLREGYAFPGKPPSLGYPDWGFVRMLRPGSLFVFYLLVRDASVMLARPAMDEILAGKSVRVRLGKFSGKARLQLEAASSLEEQDIPFQSEALLNWRDLTEDPVVCDILAMSLPTRLISRAYFTSGTHCVAHFREMVVRLPLDMRFLARQPERAIRRRTTR